MSERRTMKTKQKSGIGDQGSGARNEKLILVVVFASVFYLLPTISYSVDFVAGTGEPNDPYQIATAEQLISIGDDPNLLDKHYILINDIDLDPNLPGGQVFDRALIAPDEDDDWRFVGTPFSGTFNGNGYVLKNLIISGTNNLGLFGSLESNSHISNLGLLDVHITGSGQKIGALAGCMGTGQVIRCYSQGFVSGDSDVGGLVGESTLLNSSIVSHCYSTCTVVGQKYHTGGLIGENRSNVSHCYSTGAVSGDYGVGGLVGYNVSPTVSHCYSIGLIRGTEYLGGLVGYSWAGDTHFSVWDVDTSGISGSQGGVSLRTKEMKDPAMLALNGWANDPYWVLDAGRDYPRLTWENTNGQTIPLPDLGWLEGKGTRDDRYVIQTAEQLILFSKAEILWDKHFTLSSDVDLNSYEVKSPLLGQALISKFQGTFDGNDYAIQNLNIAGEDNLGLFGKLKPGAEVLNLGIEDVNIVGTGNNIGALVGRNNDGRLINCHSTGSVTGRSYIGHLVGVNEGVLSHCYSNGTVSGYSRLGGLVGEDYDGKINHCFSHGTVNGEYSIGGLIGTILRTRISYCFSTANVDGVGTVGGLVGKGAAVGSIWHSYSSGTVRGETYVGGLIGINNNSEFGISHCYSSSPVYGNDRVGGLVGSNHSRISHCYSRGKVSGSNRTGGLVGSSLTYFSSIWASFWDVDSSGLSDSSGGGRGLSREQMQDLTIFIDAGWDFLGEKDNGTCEWWCMPAEGECPQLSTFDGFVPPALWGQGTQLSPYLVSDVNDFRFVARQPEANYQLISDIDMEGISWSLAVIPIFLGSLDGHGHFIKNLNVSGDSLVGFIGQSSPESSVQNLNITDVNISGVDEYMGALVGYNAGCLSECYSQGNVWAGDGSFFVGGLVGFNEGKVILSSMEGSVVGDIRVGGLIGMNGSGSNLAPDAEAVVRQCWTDVIVNGSSDVGGLVGRNSGPIIYAKSQGVVTGISEVGGLIGTQIGMTARSFASSFVYGENDIGGLAGKNHGIIIDTYAISRVNGLSQTGELVGTNERIHFYNPALIKTSYALGPLFGFNDGMVDHSFYLSYIPNGNPEEYGTPLTYIQMLDSHSYLDWDFYGEAQDGAADHWYMPDNGFPALSWETDITGLHAIPDVSDLDLEEAEERLITTGFSLGTVSYDYYENFPTEYYSDLYGRPKEISNGGVIRTYPSHYAALGTAISLLISRGPYNWSNNVGTGSIGDPYVIETASQLDSLRNHSELWDKHFILAADIDLQENIYKQAFFAWDEGYSSGFQGIPFTGHFNGNDHSIKNFQIFNPERSYVGFFGSIGIEGRIESLSLTNASVISWRSYQGILAGENAGALIDCEVDGTVIGGEYLGGLAGINTGTVTRCRSIIQISGNEYAVGAVIGYNDPNTGIFNDISAEGTINGLNAEELLIGAPRSRGGGGR